MNDTPLKQIIESSLENIKNVLDANTVAGKPIDAGNGTVIIPISKVSVGITSGGVDYDGKKETQNPRTHFGGANGAGVAVTPVAFLVVTKDDVRLLNVDKYASSSDNIVGTIADFLDRSPDLIKRIKDVFPSKGAKEPEPADEE